MVGGYVPLKVNFALSEPRRDSRADLLTKSDEYTICIAMSRMQY